MQQYTDVQIEVLESHIAVSVTLSNEAPRVGDANQILFDHPHPLVNQWLLLPDNYVGGVVWMRKRTRPFQLFYCGPGVTNIPIDQATLPEPSICMRLYDGATKHQRVVSLPTITTLYVRKFMDEIFYARRLLTVNGTFSSKYWGVHHLATGIGLHPCADDCAAGALERVSSEMLRRHVTEEQLKARLAKFAGDPTMLWEGYIETMTKPLSAFDASHRAAIKLRRGAEDE